MEQYSSIDPQFISDEERAKLVRLCASKCGNPAVAEDLAQETLLEAWRHEQALRDPTKRSQWLAGIARNVCMRWRRRQYREETHRFQGDLGLPGQDDADQARFFVDDYDLEQEFERKELLELLERAMSLLPEDTRAALIQHYLEDAPLSEVARELGANPGALAVRLQRGKQTMRRLLSREMQSELSAYRELDESQTWEQTPLWCYRCGMQRLLGKRSPEAGKLVLRCPVCSPGQQEWLSMNELPLLRGMSSYKPMLSKLREWCHIHYRSALTSYFGGNPVPCEICKLPLIVFFDHISQLPERMRVIDWDWNSPWTDDAKMVITFCPHCKLSCNTTLSGLTLNVPEVRNFASGRPRILTLPAQRLEAEGRPALLLRFESVTENVALDVISDEETYEVLRIERVGH